MRRPTSHDVNLLVYLEVFTIASTVFIVAFIAVVALLFTCVACFVKHDALHADPDREEFNLLSGLALAAGILGQLGYPIGESCRCHLATFHLFEPEFEVCKPDICICICHFISVARRTSTKILLLSTCILFYVIFAFYTAVLTSEMTVLPAPFTVESLSDVLAYDFDIAVWDQDFVYENLAASAPETVKWEVFNKKIK